MEPILLKKGDSSLDWSNLNRNSKLNQGTNSFYSTLAKSLLPSIHSKESKMFILKDDITKVFYQVYGL